jgi:hypothetical protein
MNRHKCKLSYCNQPVFTSGPSKTNPNSNKGRSVYCQKHKSALSTYAHPEGRPIRFFEYEREYEEVSVLFRRNLDHKALKAACEWIDEFITDAEKEVHPVGNSDISRIREKGSDYIDILTELSAIWVFSQRSPKALEDDIRLTVALGIVFFKYSKREYQPVKKANSKTKVRHNHVGKSAKIYVGKRIRQDLGAFLFNVHSAVERVKELREKRREQMFEDLETSMEGPTDNIT